MDAVRLDFQRSQRPLPWQGWSVLLLALAVAAGLAWQLRELSGQVDGEESRLARLEARQKRLAGSLASGKAGAETRREVGQANDVLRQLTLPWHRLFEALEASSDDSVVLLAVEPDPARQRVLVGGEAKDYAAVLAYLARLDTQPVFGRVQLQSHQIQTQDRDRPVRFTALADWRDTP